MTDKSTHDHDPEASGTGEVAGQVPAAPPAGPPAEEGYVWHNALLQDPGLQGFLQQEGITLPPRPEGPEYEALLENLKNNGYPAYAARLRAARFQPKAVRSTVIGQTVAKATDRSNAREKARRERTLIKDERGKAVQRKFNPVPWLIGGALLLAGTGLTAMLWPKGPAQAVASSEVCEAPNVLNAQGACVPIVAPTGDPSIPANPNAEEAGTAEPGPQAGDRGTDTTGTPEAGAPPEDGAQPAGNLEDTAAETRRLQEAYEQGRAAGKGEGRSEAAQESNDAARAAYDSGRQAGLSEGRSLGAASARTVPAPAPVPTPTQSAAARPPVTPAPARTPVTITRSSPPVAAPPVTPPPARTFTPPPPVAVARPSPPATPRAALPVPPGPTAGGAPAPVPPPVVGRLSVSTPAGGGGTARTAPGLTTATNRNAASSAGGGQTSVPARLTFAPPSTPNGGGQGASQGRLSSTASAEAPLAGRDVLAGSQGGGAGGVGGGTTPGGAASNRSGPGLTMIRAQGPGTSAERTPTIPAPVGADAASGQMNGALTFKGQSGVQPNVPAVGAAGTAGTPGAVDGSGGAASGGAASTGAASAGGAAEASPYGPYRPFQTLGATLESAPVVIEQVDTSDLPVIARSEDGRKWVGYPTTSGPNRMIIRFTGYVDDDNRTLVPVAAASYDLSGAPGLQASSQDLAPDFVKNLVRRSATGVRDYANAALAAKETVVTGNTVITTPKEPNIWTTVAGSALGVFDLPADQRTFYRGAYLPVGTPFVIMVGASQKLNTPGR
ncbi:hypothetical protein [Deinococcus petrolearius]|uniref:Uncharacterized protein n=1 Tax=Deinococcus petrolearius TaxID=1751295 RepID=A0ABW1DLC6_9DEIO